jgi:nucleoside-diphosphate-sugar epimerase
LRVIVTGGSGFIGTNLIEYLAANGDDILNLDIVAPRNSKQTSYWKHVDLCDAVKLREAIHHFLPEVIFHLGARTDLDGLAISDYAANTTGVENLIAGISDLSSLQRIIFASSRLVCRIGYQPENEFDYCPTTTYGESKVLGEKIVRESSSRIPCPWIIVRPTSIWGPWFDVPYKTFFLTIFNGKYFHPGEVNIQKSFGFVGNTVYQLHCLSNVPLGEYVKGTIYLGDYPAIDVEEMANKIQSTLGVAKIKRMNLQFLRVAAVAGDILKRIGWKNPPLTSFRLNNLLTQMIYDLSPLQTLVGELPFTMSQGVDSTVDWMRQNGTFHK